MSDRTNGAGVMRLSLNVPAVERLLGGDPELEIALRDQVKQQIFTNHLGAMLADPAVKKMVDEFKAQIDVVFRDECQKQIGVVKQTYSYEAATLRLSSEFQTLLANLIRKNLEPFVRGMIEEHALRLTGEWLALADKTIQKKMDAGIEKAINEGIAKRLAAAAAKVG